MSGFSWCLPQFGGVTAVDSITEQVFVISQIEKNAIPFVLWRVDVVRNYKTAVSCRCSLSGPSQLWKRPVREHHIPRSISLAGKHHGRSHSATYRLPSTLLPRKRPRRKQLKKPRKAPQTFTELCKLASPCHRRKS